MIVLLREDPRRFTKLTGQSAPECDEVLIGTDEPTRAKGVIHDGNPLSDDGPPALERADGWVVMWSGSLADDPSAPHPQNWMPAGRESLDAFCGRVRPLLAARDQHLIFRPHSRHILSDPPSCVKFLQDHDGEPFGIALDPAAMFEPSMIEDLEDHLIRMIETLGPRCSMVILEDVRVAEAGEACASVPLGRGGLPRDLTIELLEQRVPPGTPIAITAEDSAAQLEWLGCALSSGVDRS